MDKPFQERALTIEYDNNLKPMVLTPAWTIALAETAVRQSECPHSLNTVLEAGCRRDHFKNANCTQADIDETLELAQLNRKTSISIPLKFKHLHQAVD